MHLLQQVIVAQEVVGYLMSSTELYIFSPVSRRVEKKGSGPLREDTSESVQHVERCERVSEFEFHI